MGGDVRRTFWTEEPSAVRYLGEHISHTGRVTIAAWPQGCRTLMDSSTAGLLFHHCPLTCRTVHHSAAPPLNHYTLHLCELHHLMMLQQKPRWPLFNQRGAPWKESCAVQRGAERCLNGCFLATDGNQRSNCPIFHVRTIYGPEPQHCGN